MDDELRSAEREGKDIAALARALQLRARTGLTTSLAIEVAAMAGSEVAQLVCGLSPQRSLVCESRVDALTFIHLLWSRSFMLSVHAAVTCCALAFNSVAPGERLGRAERSLRLARSWLQCPCSLHVQLACEASTFGSPALVTDDVLAASLLCCLAAAGDGVRVERHLRVNYALALSRAGLPLPWRKGRSAVAMSILAVERALNVVEPSVVAATWLSANEVCLQPGPDSEVED